ncbi:hypothetical protein IAT38_004926 [Cryptococcus sp. DSM 104549]
MDPLSPANINAGWASPSASPPTPTTALSPPPPTHSTTPTPTSASFASQPNSAASSSFVREPKVFGAPGFGLVSPPPDGQGGQGQGGQAGKAREVYLRVRIGALERNRKDLLIRFDASANLPNFRTSLYRNMQRSYAEFQRFAEQAQVVCPQTIIPALPLPSTAAVTDEEEDRLVRIALQRWFTRICEDPVLMRDDELRSFIESDFGYSPVPPPSARRPTSSSSAVFGALSKVPFVRRGPLDEDDELQSAKVALDKLEERWGGAAAAVGAQGKARRALAVSNAEVGAKLISLSTVESDPNLASSQRKIGRTWEQLSGMMGAQAASENVILSDSLGYQALNARAAKEALLQRTQVLEDSQSATKTAINKRRNVERLKSSSSINPAKVDDAISEMQEADGIETSLTNRVHAISQNLHIALRAHSRHAHEDVAVSLLEAARMSAMYHKQTLRELESLRNDLQRVGTATVLPPPPVTGAGAVGGGVGAGVNGMPPRVQTTPQRVGQPVQRQPPIPQPSFVPQQAPAPVAASQPSYPRQPPHQAPYPSGPHTQPQPQPAYAAQPAYRPQPPAGPAYTAQRPQQPMLHPQGQTQPGPQPGMVSRGYASPPRASPAPMDTSRSMFLPPSQGRGFDPLGQGSAGPQGPQGPGPQGWQGQQQQQQQYMGHGAPGMGPLNGGMGGGMTQSMMLPGQHQGQGQGQGQQGAGPGRRRLDERQAARMLAGGF